ncbi:MAG: UDP-N-acetylmuramoyl-L-alanine--D-glutamate ligase [Holosporaceae bacterium]|nr:UDP-N-acetylmuramoyl-L-alanine--D-glutamate ligase [Holosporaceae bacterium]
MIFLDYYKNKRVGVLGLGKTGKSVADSLIASGAEVRLYDDRAIVYRGLTASNKLCDEKLAALIVSPGINILWPKVHPIIKAARENLIPILSDLDLFQQQAKNKKTICITGTNGKSTTTVLTRHLFNSAGKKTEIGGNFGIPLLLVDPNADFFVFELSSHQLESSFILGFDTAILLNISPDHLMRHGGMEGYIAAKQKIFANFHEKSTAIIGVDDERCVKIFEFLKKINHPRVIPISGDKVPDFGIGWEDDNLVDNRFNSREIVCGKIPDFDGKHNRQNIAAAYAAFVQHGLDKKSFHEKLLSFKGLEHRQEIVARIDGVLYVNDSKATNADSTKQALKRFDNIIWILGGRPKEDGIGSLVKYFDKIRFAFLIGEAAEDFAVLLSERGVKNEIAETLDEAVRRSKEFAKIYNADVVLLSPACASFDQFRDFEERGERFKNLVGETT